MPILTRRHGRAPLLFGALLIAIALGVPAAAAAAGGAGAATAVSGTDQHADHAAATTTAGTRLAAMAPGPVRIPPAGNGQLFKSTCLPSHIAMDDPIVFPGVSGASHEHVFFGNVTTDANSTLATLRGQPTSCRIAEDHAAYWIPSLRYNGRTVAPRFLNAYYLADGARGHIVAFPPGLKVIAGNSKATTAQALSITGWKCANTTTVALSATPVACPADVDQVLVIRFPDCWNGLDLDSTDHKSHLAYRVRGACPSTHPVALPQLSLNVHYRLPSLTGLTLASGSLLSAHADFFNAWNQAVLAALVAKNLN